MRLVERVVPPSSADELARALANGQAYLHRLGISAWQDAWVLPAQLDAYRAAAAAGALSARVVAALKWRPEAGDGQLASLVEQRRTARVGRLQASAVKIVQDGVFENFTAAMLDPYLGRGGERGISMLPADELARVVTVLDGEGFDVHVHAIGDRAVREALDAFAAAARANGRRDARHQIAHLQFVHPDDRPRFRRLGVIANAQPFWAVLDGYMRKLTLPFVSAERAAWQYPWASLRRAGAALAFGSDWSVSTPDPLALVEVAVTRVAPDDRSGEPFLPAERLDLPAALDAVTIGAAYANRLDATTGSIEPGKLADLAVLDRVLFDPAAGPVGDARVLATFVEGAVVHADKTLGW
jgi:predicted amidohydrolase YtcJ